MADARTGALHTESTRLPRRTLPAIASGLAGLGLAFGASALWPDVLDEFDVSDGLFGVLSGIGLALAFPVLLFGDRLTARFTKFSLLTASLVIIAVATFGFGVGKGSAAGFAAILLLRGLGVALLDLTANALAMDIERLTVRHVMGQLHAMFNGGAILGSIIVAIGLAVGVGFQGIYVFFGALLLCIAYYTFPLRTLDPEPYRVSAGPSGSILMAASNPVVRRAALLLTFAFAGEIIILDWLALYLEDERGTAGSFAAVCLGLFGVAMLVGRVANGRTLSAIGIRRTLYLQGGLAVAGGALIVFGDSTVSPLAGCVVAGLGLSGVGPTALSVAGLAMPGSASAAAGMTLAFGYVGFAGIPVVGGALAEAFSTQITMALLLLLGTGIVCAAAILPRALDQPSGRESTRLRAS